MGLLLLVALLASVGDASPSPGKTNALFSLRLPKGAHSRLESMLFEEVSNPKSAMYGAFLTNADIRKVVGASPSVIRSVIRHLELQGFENIR